MSKARREKVNEAVKRIREFWSLGRGLPLQEYKEGYPAGVNKAAEATGLTPDTVGKARAFADPVSGYSLSELNAMCRMIREVQPGQDEEQEEKPAVFSRTHVIRLLSVPKRFRPGIQREAITKGWSIGELERRIAARFGSRSAGGRPRRVPRDVPGQLV